MKPMHPQYKFSDVGLTTENGKGILSAPVQKKREQQPKPTVWNEQPVAEL